MGAIFYMSNNREITQRMVIFSGSESVSMIKEISHEVSLRGRFAKLSDKDFRNRVREHTLTCKRGELSLSGKDLVRK